MAAADTYELLHEETDCSLLKEILEKTLAALLPYQEEKQRDMVSSNNRNKTERKLSGSFRQ